MFFSQIIKLKYNAHTFWDSKPLRCFQFASLEVLHAQIFHIVQVAPPCNSDIHIYPECTKNGNIMYLLKTSYIKPILLG